MPDDGPSTKLPVPSGFIHVTRFAGFIPNKLAMLSFFSTANDADFSKSKSL